MELALFVQVATGVIGLSSAVIALYVAMKLATMENRLFLRINGSYVRRETFEEHKRATDTEIDKIRAHAHDDRGTVTALMIQVAHLQEKK